MQNLRLLKQTAFKQNFIKSRFYCDAPRGDPLARTDPINPLFLNDSNKDGLTGPRLSHGGQVGSSDLVNGSPRAPVRNKALCTLVGVTAGIGTIACGTAVVINFPFLINGCFRGIQMGGQYLECHPELADALLIFCSGLSVTVWTAWAITGLTDTVREIKSAKKCLEIVNISSSYVTMLLLFLIATYCLHREFGDDITRILAGYRSKIFKE